MIGSKIFVFDNKEKYLTTLSNNNTKSCPFYDDLLTEYLAHGGSTFDFSVPMNHPDSVHLQNEGYVVVQVDGEFVQFRIKQVEDTKDGLQKRVLTDNAALELGHQYVRPSQSIFLNPRDAMVHILDGSRHEVGIVEVTEERNWQFTEYKNKIAALNELKSAFNARLRYRIQMNKENTKIVKRYVDLLKNEPIRTGKRIDYRRDIAGLRRVRKSYELFTAVIPTAQDADGNLITIAGIEWRKDQGAPADKPPGQDWIGDEEALQKWGIGDQHIFYHYESTTAKNANDLIDEAWSFLQAHKEPQPEYDVDMVFLERLGYEHDKVRSGHLVPVFDFSFNPPVLVDSTVVELRRSSTNPQNDKVILGDYKELNYRIPDSIKKLQEKLKIQKDVIDTKTKIIHSVTVPNDTSAIWVDISQSPNIIKTWDGSAWVKATPTQASEVGADVAGSASQAESNAKSHADTKANQAETNAKAHADNVANQAEQNAKNYAEKKVSRGYSPPSNPTLNDLWIDKNDGYIKQWTGTEWKPLAPTTPGEIGAVSQSEYNLKVQDLENDIATKVDATWVNGQLVSKADKADTYTKTEVDNALNAKVSITTYTTDRDGIVTQLDNHESRITQTENEITTKVNQTQYDADVGDLQTRMNSAETSITQNANSIALKANATDVYTKTQVDTSLANKADNSTVNAIEQRVTQTEAELVVQADEIATKVSQTDFDNLNNTVSNHETRITQTESNITLKANASDVYTKGQMDSSLATKANQSTVDGINSRLTTAESTLSVHSNQISTKVSQTDFDNFKTISLHQKGDAPNVDWNTIQDTGIYNVNYGTGAKPTNFPSGAYGWGTLIVEKSSNNTVTQTYKSHSNPIKTYSRMNYNGSNWRSWEEVTNKTDFNILEGRVTTAESSITQLSNEIELKVSQQDYDIDIGDLTSRMTSAESTLSIHSNQISTKVEQNGVISAINQTAESIKIQASKIQFEGAVFGQNATFSGAIKTTGSNGSVTIENDTIEQILGDKNVSVGSYQKAYLTSGEVSVEEIFNNGGSSTVTAYTRMKNGLFTAGNSFGDAAVLGSNYLEFSKSAGTIVARVDFDSSDRLNLNAPSVVRILKKLELTGDLDLTGKILMTGNQAVVSGSDGLYLYTDYGVGGDRYLKIKDDGAVFIVVDGSTKHSFYAGGTKSGGSIVIDGKNLGMSPVDSPQILIEYIEFDIPLTESGTKVYLEDRFRKAIENFAVFSNNGQVIEKGDDYFVISGEGTADIRIVGERIGYSGAFFDDLDAISEVA